MASQGFPLPLRLCVLYFLLLMLCMSNEKFKSGVSCSETLHSNVSDFEANDHLQMVTTKATTNYILALQWPPSICMSKRCDINPVPKQFTIHGLWPSTGKTDCNPNDKFDYLRLDKDTRDRLDKAWPSLLKSGQQAFLGHEWAKHGTCSGLTQEVYFKTALDLHTSVNVLGRVIDINFGPDPKKKYNPSEIIEAYEKKWGLKIKIKCVKKRDSTEEMIGEIHFKVTITVESITGSITGPTTAGCTKDTKVSFPDKYQKPKFE